MTRQDERHAFPGGKEPGGGRPGVRALNRWARNQGYADFDTFIRVGGSIAEACENIDHRIAMLEDAKVAAGRYGDNGHQDVSQHHSAPAGVLSAIGPDALAAAEADVVGEPVDPDNAQIQGFDHAGN